MSVPVVEVETDKNVCPTKTQNNPAMKKILIILLLLPVSFVFSQTAKINLFNPSNELFLFSAFDEGALGFRYNPGVLGLGHKFNLSVGWLMEKKNTKVEVNEFDVLVNSGNFGFAFRSAGVDSWFTLHVLSLGLGFGNKTFSAGGMLEHTHRTLHGTGEDFDIDGSRWSGGLGLIFRPSEFVSTALTFKSSEALSRGNNLSGKLSAGIGIRPMKNNRLTLLFDGGTVAYRGENIFQTNFYKAGVDVKIFDGFHLNASYMRINDIIKTEFINAGFTFDAPHISVRNNNTGGRHIGYRDFDLDFNRAITFTNSNIILSYSSEKKETIISPGQRILEISLSGNLQDYHTEDVFFGVLGKGKRSIHEVIADIDYAANDESVKGIIMKVYPLSTGRMEINAAIEELTNAMARFRRTGKNITVYFPEDARPAEYYIGTFADKIVMPEEGILFYGLSMEVINYKQFLEKYGIELQTFYAGKYKLTFQGVLDSTTEEGKEVINRILDIVYDKMLARISEGRNIKIDDYMRTKLSQPLSGREAKRLGLVDENGWYEDAKNIAEKESKLEGRFTKRMDRKIWDNGWSEPEQIAIIGVYGGIRSGESEPPDPFRLPLPFIGGGRTTGSETVVRQLENAFSNPKVKVVILRVDSGGGSALASAEINEAVIRLKKKHKKLFIVSMGGAAASGGYEVSVSADRIFSDELTVTGSIGVLYQKPNLDSLVKGQKIKVETFKRGDYSDIGSIFKGVNEEEIEIIQGLIDFYYDKFIEAVARGRKMTKEEVEKAAQGRVWLGTDAFRKRLVDEIGGLYEAVNYAKKKSKLDKRFKLVYYEVPGGETISDIVTGSIVKFLEKMIGIEDEDEIGIRD